jgi:hypothetical protein
MGVTKQDFESIAALLKAARIGYDDQDGHVGDVVDNLARDMAQYFESQNPHFDPPRFLAAAGVQ